MRSTLITLATAGILAVGVGVAAPAATAATRCPTPARSVLSTTPAHYSKTVALTFDDGPSKYTPQILAVLKAKGVEATFFVTGRHARQYPGTLRQIVAAGHKIGNHTDTHPQNIAGSSPRASFDSLSATSQAGQMDATTRAILSATGTRPCFFRAPGGHHWTSTTRSLARTRSMSVTSWTVDTRDWAQPRYSSRSYQNSIVRLATTTGSRHPIVLMHDGKASPEPERTVSANRSNSVAALSRVIDYYTARGYVFTDPAARPFAAPPSARRFAGPPADFLTQAAMVRAFTSRTHWSGVPQR